MIIKFENLIPNKYNPRKTFRSASMEELKESIKNYGLIEPLVVRPLKNGKYEVICGMRRYYALKDLAIKEVECHIKDVDDIEAIDLAFMENLQRENLTPIEEGKMYETRLKFFPEYEDLDSLGNTITINTNLLRKLSTLYAISESTIRNRLRLLNLPIELQNEIENSELPLTIAYEIARLNQIGEVKFVKDEMLEMYNDYKLEKETISLSEIKLRITNKINYYKSKEVEQKAITDQRINELEKKIEETNKSKDTIVQKLEKKIEEILNNNAFDNDLFSKIDMEQDLREKGKEILQLLMEENQKYASDKAYEDIVSNINEIENDLSDIKLLISRMKEKSIRVCPFCFAKIDLPAIRRKEGIYNEELDELKKKRKLIAGIKGFISDAIAQIEKYDKALKAKDDFILRFNNELEALNENI